MNKNKTLIIKIIFKTYFKILKHKLRYFRFSKRFLCSKHHKTNKKLFYYIFLQNLSLYIYIYIYIYCSYFL